MSRFGDLQVRTSKNSPSPTSEPTLVRFAFWGISCGVDFKKPQCLFCLFCLFGFVLVGWLVGWLFCFVSLVNPWELVLANPLKKNTFLEETNQLAIFGFRSSDPPGFRLDHLFKKIVLGVASLGRTGCFFLMQQVYTVFFFVSRKSIGMGFFRKSVGRCISYYCKLFLYKGDHLESFRGCIPWRKCELQICIGSVKNLERSSTQSGKW